MVTCSCLAAWHGADLASCDAWLCDCGNYPEAEGFHHADKYGAATDEETAFWLCDRCHTLYDRHGQETRIECREDVR
jgi:hypothetical protein